MEYISFEEILTIHSALVEEFAGSDDPIAPSGIKSRDLLHSAVSRQSAGYGEWLKYNTVEAVSATLLYGVVHNHPFHNGNKRTALVAMLVQLDRNNRTFVEGVNQRHLYDLMLAVAGHRICDGRRAAPDEEIDRIRNWIRARCRAHDTHEKSIKFRDLRRILGRFGYVMENPRGNFIDLVKVDETPILFGLIKQKTRQKIKSIPYPGESAEVRRPLIKRLRKELGLDDTHGIDSQTFYDERSVVDGFIAKNKTLLRNLAKV